MKFPFPVLLCDIGGTNARFALVPASGAPLEAGPHLKTKDFPGLEDALVAIFAGLDIRPRSLIACAAGPVGGRAVKMTNADWTIDGADVAAKVGLDQGLLLNDFEAQALSLPVLKSAWVQPIGAFAPTPGAQLIMGLGTGLGVAVLLDVESRHFALASEAGHMGFGPLEAEETALWPYLDRGSLGRVCAETLLSGPGLMRLHRARCTAAGKAAAESSEIVLIERAHAQPGGEEAATLRLCWTLTARFAGDLALAFLAKGGVTFSGGILPRIVEFCDRQKFRAAFEDKAPYREMMRAIGARLILAEDAVLCGMAAIANAPQNYAIDYANRAWR
ncbi:MAG: glucokinase [Methylocella sp.]|nr:MAG: glucokinase [Hyphomicrobiales bacterium]